ncbi:helix-turn-helix domain-containing protein [Parafilimonas sp.]|uniref:helix-turn-helix domain-containing protein n=1 Tax=Parafilimonas sp. TaxID=1969739 RepID=UPI0039E4ECA9
MAIDSDNKIFQLAESLVNESNRNIFLTGKAGTGKTTFLKHIRQNCIKQIAVTAPTGVAAINAGGATIHSFFQLPLSPFIPEASGFMPGDSIVNKHSLLGRMRLNNEKRKVLQQLELLIIDEISMVRCDTLDAIDTVLRHFRYRYNEPFGGVQVLFIGDMFQLPPIIPDNEWNLLRDFYSSPYFFDSQVMRQFPPVYVEFQKIYRQSDEKFIHLLNEVRHNNLSDAGMDLLNSRYDPWFELGSNDGYIFLTTHNYKSDSTNAEELAKLKRKAFLFKAEVTGEFNEKAYPADEKLELKIGAQVMFIRNDKEKIKRYFNGKIGTVTKIEEDAIFVQCKDEAGEIEVSKETWENIRYAVDKQTQQLEEDVIGKFVQYPLRLAWAITIHKSQGLTFEKAVIDAGRAFAPGQVYVALSRCTSLTGIVLKSQITPSGLQTDKRIIEFSEQAATEENLQEQLHQSKKIYQQNLLLALFDFAAVIKQCTELNKTVKDNKAAYNAELLLWLDGIEKTITELQTVADKFKLQLNKLFITGDLPEENDGIQQRLHSAAEYFAKQLEVLMGTLRQSPASTDSKQHAKVYNDGLKEIFILLAEKRHLLQCCIEQFSVSQYYHYKKNFAAPSFYVNAYATASEQKTESPHPELHKKLRALRNKICDQKNVPIYYVANSATIDEMALYLPQNLEEIVKIKGFGQAKAKQYGYLFLEVINAYCNEHNLASSVAGMQPKKERKQKSETIKEDTKNVSYALFREGNQIADIAKLRNLSVGTIEGHLAFYVQRGIISINELVEREKFVLIEPLLENFEGTSITPIKEKLGDSISYGEIRMVIAAKEWERAKNNAQDFDNIIT